MIGREGSSRLHHSDQEMGDPSVLERRLLGAATYEPSLRRCHTRQPEGAGAGTHASRPLPDLTINFWHSVFVRAVKKDGATSRVFWRTYVHIGAESRSRRSPCRLGIIGNRDGFGKPGAQVHHVKKGTYGGHLSQVNCHRVIELQGPGDGHRRTRRAGRRQLAGVTPVDCRRHRLEHLGVLRTRRPQQLIEAGGRAMHVLGVQLERLSVQVRRVAGNDSGEDEGAERRHARVVRRPRP